MLCYECYAVRGFDPATRTFTDEHLVHVNPKIGSATVDYDAVQKLPPGYEIALELDFTQPPSPDQLEIISRCLARNRITTSGEPTIVKAEDDLWEICYTGILRNEIVRIPKALEEIGTAMRPYDKPR